MAHRIYSRPARSARRATEWIGSADTASPQALAGSSVFLDQFLTGAQVAAISPFTITRTVGSLTVMSDQVAAAEYPFLGVGAMVVSEVARVAGIASLPTPFLEESDDAWFLYVTGAAGGGTINGAPAQTVHFDSRAQRKVEEGSAVVWTVENASSAFGLLYWLKFRMLVKLH